MDNLINYVKENGYKTFKELKFNEVDAAIYCVLSYINFDGIKIKNIKIKDLYEIYKTRFTLKEKDKFNQKNRESFQKASDTKTISSLIMKKKSTKLLNFKL